MLASQGNKTFISLFGAACDKILSDFSEYYYVVNLYMICFYPISFEKLSSESEWTHKPNGELKELKEAYNLKITQHYYFV